jgi:hypothetical protein
MSVNLSTKRAAAGPNVAIAQRIKPWCMNERVDPQWMKRRSRVMRAKYFGGEGGSMGDPDQR